MGKVGLSPAGLTVGVVDTVLGRQLGGSNTFQPGEVFQRGFDNFRRRGGAVRSRRHLDLL